MSSAKTLIIGMLLAIAAPGLLAQTNPAATKRVASSAKAGGHRASTPKAKAAVAHEATPEATDASAPADTGVRQAGRRDPFESLVSRQQAQARENKNLPPGIPGLQIGTLRVDGIVKSSNGMIAVVTNPQARTYFLREGDQLYDGRVEKISMDGVSFHELGKDAFGKPVERQVNKRIYSSAGEQQ
jgi:Tfp pilus assembly protein PilP